MSSSITTDTINSFLDPKLHQVIGSTPESLRSSVESMGIEGKADMGMQFCALAIFACTVNKPTVEQFYVEEKFKDLRPIASRAFLLNNKVNMTALSLAGHCLMTSDVLADVNYVREFRRKIGQNSIWDGNLAGGSISDTQRKIFVEKSQTHSKANAVEFATWFFSHTGITAIINRGRSGDATSESSRAREKSSISYEVPDDITKYWFTDLGRSKKDLDKIVTDRGIEGAWTKIRGQMGKRGGSVV